ncbi:uncharacterized protein LOC133662730 isoform X1 [Entelurus aequoreus]|uniref:uncharacterized protein LOC133662730 isoform X1 n=1 Tax=Entelurus aequoreus TaxID=161455 RepID=UPI002B1E4858|nr:uncharacterized protein LOC133662730 isoform X1 [Entelurus aequoreus]
MLHVTRLLFVVVLVCAAVMSLIMCSPPARASPAVRVRGVKRSLYSAYLSPSSGRQSSQGALSADSKADMSGSSNHLLPSHPQHRGQSKSMYPAFIRRPAPFIAGHSSHQSSRNPTEDAFEDASRVDTSRGGRTTWKTSSGRYMSALLSTPAGRHGGHKDTEELSPSERDASWRPNKFQSFLFKDSQPPLVAISAQDDPAYRPQDEEVKEYSPYLVQSDSEEEHLSLLAAISGGVKGASLGSLLPPVAHFHSSSKKSFKSDAMTTRRPVSAENKWVFKHANWASSMAFPGFSPANKGHTFKITNVYPSLSSKYSFSQRRAFPSGRQNTSTVSQQARILDLSLLRGYKENQTLGFSPFSTLKPAEVTKLSSSNKSVVQQIFEGLEPSQLRHLSASTIPNQAQNESNSKEMQNEKQRAAFSPPSLGFVVSSASLRPVGGAKITEKGAGLRPNGTSRKLAERRARLLSTFTSSTVRGVRVHANDTKFKHFKMPAFENWPIVRRPKKPASRNVTLESFTSTTQTPGTASFPNSLEELMQGRDNTSWDARGPTMQSESNTTTWQMFNDTELLDMADSLETESEALEEDLLELHYLQISTINTSFKSINNLDAKQEE